MSAISTLIDFIFDNIFIVVAALFFLFKLLGNRTGGQKPTSMPTFGGDQQQKQWDDDEDDEPYPSQYEQEQLRRQQELEQQRQRERAAIERQSTEPVAAAPVRDSRFQSTSTASSYEEVKREQQRKQALARLKAQAEKQEGKKASSVPQAIQLESSDLRKAIVWSEILGQPRAKRPHRRF